MSSTVLYFCDICKSEIPRAASVKSVKVVIYSDGSRSLDVAKSEICDACIGKIHLQVKTLLNGMLPNWVED